MWLVWKCGGFGLCLGCGLLRLCVCVAVVGVGCFGFGFLWLWWVWPVLWAAEFLYVCVWPGPLWLVCVCMCVFVVSVAVVLRLWLGAGWLQWLCVCVCLMLIWVWTSSLPEEWLWPFHGNKTLTAIQTRTHKDGRVKIVLSWFKLVMDFGGIFWCSFWQGQYVENGFFDCYWEGAWCNLSLSFSIL